MAVQPNAFCNSLEELIAEDISLARTSLSERHFFTASAWCRNNCITTSTSVKDLVYRNLMIDKLPEGMTVEQALDKYAQAISAIDNRTVIQKHDPVHRDIAFSDYEFKKVCLQYYLPVSVDKIHSIIKDQMAKSVKHMIPESVSVYDKTLTFYWSPDFGIHYTTEYKFGLFTSMKDLLNGTAILYVINDYFDNKYEMDNKTSLTLKKEFSPYASN